MSKHLLSVKPGHTLESLLQKRRDDFSIRRLAITSHLVDFASNDYLGFARSQELRDRVEKEYASQKDILAGATGSRLITGNSVFYEELETRIAAYHGAEAGLIYNSGYDANLGFFSSVPQPGDLVLFDELVHASIRDGVKLGRAEGIAFRHNDLEDLESKLKEARLGEIPLNPLKGTLPIKGKSNGVNSTAEVPFRGFRGSTDEIYIATESIFSMDGDLAPLKEMVALCKKYYANLVVDEAHATGIFGTKGEGRIAELDLQKDCFARVHTFGKALGGHGAIVLGSPLLRGFLINFSRSFIFTTAQPLHNLVWVKCAYDLLPEQKESLAVIHALRKVLQENFLPQDNIHLQTGPGPIQAVIIPGNERARNVAAQLEEGGIYAKAILYPTVPRGKERIRICLHNFNTAAQVVTLCKIINNTLS